MMRDSSPDLTQEARAERLCDALASDIEPLEIEMREAEWRAECTGDPEAFHSVEKLNGRIMTRLSSRADFLAAENLLRDGDGLEPRRHREILRWRHRLARHQIDAETIARLAAQEAELVRSYNGFRARLGDRLVADNAIDRILLESRSSAEVEAAWRASKAIGAYRGADDADEPVAERLLSLVRLRNAAARQIGYPNAYRAALELEEMDEDWLYATLDLLERETRAPYRRLKKDVESSLGGRFGVAAADLRPWHYRDRFFQTPPPSPAEDELDGFLRRTDIVALTIESCDELGFDVRPIVERSDLFPGDPATSRKCQHAFCTSIDPPRDVRVLCNIMPGKRWMSTSLHEFGHAIYGSSLDPELPFILRDDPHTLCNEAIALLMERHLLDAGWLERVAGVPAQRARDIAARSRGRLAAKHLVFTRWVLVMCHFERALYENPERDDLGRLWWDLVERFQEIRRPEPERNQPDWAAKIHFVASPAYYQNYLIGELFGAQLEEALVCECGGVVGEPEAGAFLRRRMFRPGAVWDWRELIRRVSGRSLEPDPFLARCADAGG